jgi:hypothetical protein
MSHTDTEQTARGRRGRHQPEQPEQPTGDQPTGEIRDTTGSGNVTPEPTGDQPTEPTEAQIAEAAEIAKVQGFTPAGGNAEFQQATTPVRNRKPVQLAMDKVAEQAYADWVTAERPSTWARMPVITYFLDPTEVPEYRKLIRRACEIVTPDGDASGVRARFGKEFVLSDKMAAKIEKPEAAGKTVLAWAAIDKRKVQSTNGASTDSDG